MQPIHWILGVSFFSVIAGCSPPAGEEEAAGRSPASAIEVPLLVVDGRDDAPIAGARVTWCRLDPTAERGWFTGVAGPSPAELEERCAASGRSGVTDSEGRVLITGERLEDLRVTATTASLWGQGTWLLTPRSRPVEWRLELYPDGDLTVRVRESDGSPARDVPVSLRQYRRGPGMDERNPPEFATAFVSARSGPDGLARLRHVRAVIFEKLQRTPGEVREIRWSVAPDRCTGDRRGTAVELEPWPENSIEVTLPPTGRVELRVREPDGTPVRTDEGVVLTTVQAAEGWAGSIALMRVNPADAAWSRGGGGSVSFDRVGLGLELVAFAIRNDSSVNRWIRFAGPREPGQQVLAELVLGRDTATFKGRAVNGSGEPLAGNRLLVELQSGPSPDRARPTNGPADDESDGVSWGYVETDDEGRFALDFDAEILWGGKGLVTLTHRIGEPRCLSARFDLTDRWRAGVHELGDLVLPPAPVLVAGTVVDEEGRPLDGVRVGVCTSVREEAFSHQAFSDAAGRFAVRSAVHHPRVRLTLTKAGFEKLWADPIEAGTEDLTVVLQPKEPEPPPPRDFGPIEGCSPERFAELEARVAALADPDAAETADRAMAELAEAGKGAFPAILNAVRRLDLRREDDFATADRCRQVLETICGGHGFGWCEPWRLPDSYLGFDRFILKRWREAWIRAEQNEAEWKKLLEGS